MAYQKIPYYHFESFSFTFIIILVAYYVRFLQNLFPREPNPLKLRNIILCYIYIYFHSCFSDLLTNTPLLLVGTTSAILVVNARTLEPVLYQSLQGTTPKSDSNTIFVCRLRGRAGRKQ